MMEFKKYEALGNDYIIVDPKNIVSEDFLDIKTLCNRNYGIGSNGILVGPYESDVADCKLHIFNPDGSEAEISGNGLRIFAQYLKDEKIVLNKNFSIELNTKIVYGFYEEEYIFINMGKVNFPRSDKVLEVDQKLFEYINVDVGNPHCVIFNQKLEEKEIKRYGSLIENHFLFENRTNVQFIKILDRTNIEILIWERGAGYTLASGSSSIATAAAAYYLNLCDKEVTVHMPGGDIFISFDSNFNACMKGKANKIFEGTI